MTSPDDQTPTAGFVVIGDEILCGKTEDKNIAILARFLSDLGIDLLEVRVVGDVMSDIVGALNALRPRYRYVFTSGGIGPTHDDITADSVGAAFGLDVTEHPEARARLVSHYPPDALTPARLRMARTPVGAILIDNPVSVAPGFRVDNVHVLAGVPKIFEAMLVELAPTLTHGVIPTVLRIETTHFEGDYADPLGALALEFSSLQIGSYPVFRGKDGVVSTIQIRGRDDGLVARAAQAIHNMLAVI